MGYTVSAKAIRAPVFAAAVRTGRPPEELLRAVSVAPAVLADADARLAHERVAAAWATLAREAGDPSLGLFAAQLLDGAPLDFVDYALSHARTLGEMAASFERYQRLFHTGNASHRARRDGAVHVVFALRPEAARCDLLAEFVLSTWLRRARRAAGRAVEVRAVRLRRPAPADAAPYESAFGAAVRFAESEDALVVDPAVFDLPVAGADPSLRELLDRQATLALDRLDPGAGFLRDARRTLQSELLAGRADADSLARAMALGRRSLQRRLAEAGTCFQDVLDDVRRELALHHLHERGESATDVAFLLGFSELSAFSRAFRRWTGRSPSELRAGG